jgi:heme exporter protein A
MVLSVLDLCVSRSSQVLLANVSFELAAGQALILKGPNGLGKTTLLRAITGLQPALSGQIIAGEDSFAYAAHADGVKPSLTVAENLQFWADILIIKILVQPYQPLI